MLTYPAATTDIVVLVPGDPVPMTACASPIANRIPISCCIPIFDWWQVRSACRLLSHEGCLFVCDCCRRDPDR